VNTDSDRRDPRPGDTFPNVGYVRYMTGRDVIEIDDE
jgi:hypothetical protein